MEARRKQLMAKQVQWGDSPSPPHLAPASWDDPPPSTESQPGGDACDERDAALDASIMAEAKARKKRVERNPSTMSSCKDWTLDSLLAQSPNFVAVPHIHWSPSVRTGLEIQIQKHPHGVPLVVSGLHNHPDWPGNKFTPEWLERHHGRDTISARNVCDRTDRELTLSEFIAHARAIPPFAKPDEKERLYGKDVKCPQQWDDFLTRGVIPRYLAPKSPENLLNNLPEDKVRPETLMCYLGVGDTFTPCHKDLCASFGHNLMTYTEDGGSSFWFMTATSSAYAAAEYFHTTLKQELDHETHVITLAQLAKAPFQVYILEQKLGDLVLVPPRSAHQVVNSGGMTIKTSWSRMTLGSLSLALKYELPLYRRVCRSETYKVKATVYHTLLQMIQQLSGSSSNPQNAVASTSRNDNLKPTRDDLGRLIALFDLILIEEYSPDASHMRRLVDESPDDIDTLTCDFCGADVFQSYFECSRCVDDPKPAKYGAGLIICSGCYVEGRTCHCEVMKQMQCRSFDELLKTRQNGVKLYAAGSQRERRPVLPSTVGSAGTLSGGAGTSKETDSRQREEPI
ncbi:hypothetical protein C8R46DRAFT_145191 [Mycena filopes]|nr:hypothetical protein C8R46DRAFT_145191 [Mycena filopes]